MQDLFLRLNHLTFMNVSEGPSDPATFQCLMETCMRDLHLNCCLLYLDDIIIFSKTYGEHILCLEAVFEKLKITGSKLSPSKCHLFRKQMKCLHCSRPR